MPPAARSTLAVAPEALDEPRPCHAQTHTEIRTPRSRRDWLRGVSGLTALAAMWSDAARAAAPPSSADVDPAGLLASLVRRCTYGATQGDLALASSLGFTGYLEQQLHPELIDDADCDARLLQYPTLVMTPPELYLADADRRPPSDVINQLVDATLTRAVYSKRQLLERMVEFWNDHFNIDINDGDEAYLKPLDDRDTIRRYALDTFPNLLRASALSPAMLLYLDNANSRIPTPNENYARELMELHTLSVTGGYTQQDVHEVARCFTGWSFYSAAVANGVNAGTFRYVPAWHDTGAKTVLGQTIPARSSSLGQQDAIEVLNILAAHPSTAAFIAQKLCTRFLGEDTPTGVVNAVTTAYLATGGDIKAMLRAMLTPAHLFDAPPRFKRPMHLMVSALRALPHTAVAFNGIRTQLANTGHRLFSWGPPDGYPDTTTYWSGLLLPRLNFGALLTSGTTTGSIASLTLDDQAFFAGVTTADAAVNALNSALFLGEWPAAERTRVRDYLLPNPPSRTKLREAISLALGSPSFQWY